jgi:hypothetical protein
MAIYRVHAYDDEHYATLVIRSQNRSASER